MKKSLKMQMLQKLLPEQDSLSTRLSVDSASNERPSRSRAIAAAFRRKRKLNNRGEIALAPQSMASWCHEAVAEAEAFGWVQTFNEGETSSAAA